MSLKFCQPGALSKTVNHCNHFEEFIAPKRKYFSLSLKDNHFNSDAVTLQKLDKVVQAHKVVNVENETLKRPTMSSRYDVKTLFPEGDAQQIR